MVCLLRVLDIYSAVNMIVVTITTMFNSTIEEKIQSIAIAVVALLLARVFSLSLSPFCVCERVSSIQSFSWFEFVTTEHSLNK